MTLGSIGNGAQKSVEIEVLPYAPGPVSNSAISHFQRLSIRRGDNNSSIREVTVEVHLYLPLIIKSP